MISLESEIEELRKELSLDRAKTAVLVGALTKITERPKSGLRRDDYGYPWHAERDCTVCDQADEIAKSALSTTPERARLLLEMWTVAEEVSERWVTAQGAERISSACAVLTTHLSRLRSGSSSSKKE